MTTQTNTDELIQDIADTIELNEIGKKHSKSAYKNWTIAVIRVARALGYEFRRIAP